jgi:hypothetical protein
MAKQILLDEFHVSVFAPAGLRESRYAEVRRTLDQRRFGADLRRAVRTLFQRYPALRQVRVQITR